MPSIKIPSHRTEVSFYGQSGTSRLLAVSQNPSVDGSAIEAFEGDTIVFEPGEPDGLGKLVSARVGDEPLAQVGTGFRFTPDSDGLHVVELGFSSGRTATVKVMRLKSEWLQRMRIPGLRAGSLTEFMTEARLVARNVVRGNLAGNLPLDGSFPDGLSLGSYGAGNYGVALADFMEAAQ